MEFEKLCGDVVGLVPSYCDAGDGCLVICRAAGDENIYSFMESRSVESVKRHLARCYALDLGAQALLLRKDYQRSPPLPFYLCDGRIFVPFKLRLPKIAGDPSYGYIELGIIARVLPGESGQCLILLSNGLSLPVFSQITTARLALYFGVEIQKNTFCPQPDPDQEILQAFRTLRRYLVK